MSLRHKNKEVPERARGIASFGKGYTEELLWLIHRYLELDAHHTLAYVGPPDEHLVRHIEKYFCLLTPVTVLSRGTLAFSDGTGKSRRFPLRLSGAEEYFQKSSSSEYPNKRRFDRILLVDSVQYFNDIATTFSHASRCLRKGGKIVIIHRSPSVSTLPLFKKANFVMRNLEIPFMKIINSLQGTGCSVEWDMRHVPIRMRPQQWIKLLRRRYLPEIDYMSDREIEEGIAELMCGQFCYLTPYMELEDRLLFITGKPIEEGSYPALQRVNKGPRQPYAAVCDLDYELALKPSYKRYLQ